MLVEPAVELERGRIRGVHTTDPPAASGASSPAIRPWMWKSGITLRDRSSLVSASESAMLRAERARLRWRRGTILGRDVVPDVCNTRAMSSRSGRLAEGSTPESLRKSMASPAPVTRTRAVPSGAAA